VALLRLLVLVLVLVLVLLVESLVVVVAAAAVIMRSCAEPLASRLEVLRRILGGIEVVVVLVELLRGLVSQDLGRGGRGNDQPRRDGCWGVKHWYGVVCSSCLHRREWVGRKIRPPADFRRFRREGQ
jgi:hypothetical protein